MKNKNLLPLLAVVGALVFFVCRCGEQIEEDAIEMPTQPSECMVCVSVYSHAPKGVSFYSGKKKIMILVLPDSVDCVNDYMMVISGSELRIEYGWYDSMVVKDTIAKCGMTLEIK